MLTPARDWEEDEHDETAYPKGSRWCYNDITAATNEE
jgi:hypothetical protein